MPNAISNTFSDKETFYISYIYIYILELSNYVTTSLIQDFIEFLSIKYMEKNVNIDTNLAYVMWTTSVEF